MAARKASEQKTERRLTVGLPPALVAEVEALLAEHPAYGTNRSDFATRAVADALRQARREILEKAVLEAYKQGKPGPLDGLRR